MEVNHISQLIIEDEGTYFGIIHLHDILKEGFYKWLLKKQKCHF